MASQNPPLKNTGYTFYTSLVTQSDSRLFQASPTLAAGDVKVAVDDAAPANMATLPVIDADFTKRVKVVMSSGEMNGDNITIIFSDAAGAEWCDMTINLQTVTKQFDSLATQTSVDTIDDFLDTEIAALTTAVSVIDDFLDTEIAAIKAKTDNLPASPAAVSDIPTAVAIADAVLDDALTEPAATFTWAGATLRTVVAWLGALARNRILQTNTLSTLRNDANSADLSTSVVSDDGSTFIRSEWS